MHTLLSSLIKEVRCHLDESFLYEQVCDMDAFNSDILPFTERTVLPMANGVASPKQVFM